MPLRSPRVASIALAPLTVVSALGAAGLTATAAGATSPVPTGPVPNLVTNGHFAVSGYINEDPVRPGATGAARIPAWSAGGAGIYLISTSVIKAPLGLGQSVGLSGPGGPGTITQTVKTTPGTTYLLQWYGAANPGPQAPSVKTMNVLWDNGVVDAPKYNAAGHSDTAPGWALNSVVVTATSASSSIEFSDSMPTTSTYAALVADVTLGGDAKLYLPATTTVSPTAKIMAVVDNAKGAPLSGTSLSVSLYGLIKATSYAPAVLQLIASAHVVNGQAALGLKLPRSEAGKTITAYAVLQGGVYIPVTKELMLKVT